MPLTPGTRLGPYEIAAPLGSGGMGEVYRAHDTRLHRDVAVKVLPAAVASDPDRRARFEREAHAIASLNDPNICVVHDVGRDGDTEYLVMELLEGESLAHRLERGPLPWARAADLAAAVADGLGAAHARGIVHRDLKPANIWLTVDGRAKVLDFGLARRDEAALGALGETATQVASLPGTIVGTIGYMAPEQVRGEAADARSDIFSLGCVLYEMVSGARPFGGSSGADAIAALLGADPPPLTSVPGGLPPPFLRIVERCLAKRPDERFQSARDLAYALRASADSPATRPGGQDSGGAGAIPARQRRGVSGIALVLCGLAAGGLATWGVLRTWGGTAPARDPAWTVTPLTQGTAQEYAPEISPDGKWVAYLSDAGGRTNIWVKFVGGGPPSNLTERFGWQLPTNTVIGGMDIAPDGTSIAVRAQRPGEAGFGGGGIWLVPSPLPGPPRQLIAGAAAPRWSPDGTRLAYIRSNMVAGDALCVSNADGQSERVVVPASNGVHVHQPAWSADGSALYYLRSIEIAGKPPTEIWRVALAGGAPQPVVTGHSAQMPRPGPDGRWLFYAWSTSGDALNIWRLPLAGGAAERLTTGAGEYVEPSLSRDGRRLVVTARRVDRSLAAVRADGADTQEPVLVTPALSGDHEPAVAVSGQIVFTTTRNGVPNLWTTMPGDTESRPLTSGADVDGGPAISPDGSTVAFVSNRGERRGIWVVPAAGGVPRQVARADVLDRVSWSPDGTQLVFAAAVDEVPWLWTVASAGGTPARIPGAEGRTPSWCPARDVIAYRAKDGLRLIDGTGRSVLPAPLPRAPVEFTALAWSHDGRRLAIGTAAGFQYPAVWILDLDPSPRYTRVLSSSRYYRVDGLAWQPDDRFIVFGRTQYTSQVLLLEAAPDASGDARE